MRNRYTHCTINEQLLQAEDSTILDRSLSHTCHTGRCVSFRRLQSIRRQETAHTFFLGSDLSRGPAVGGDTKLVDGGYTEAV